MTVVTTRPNATNTLGAWTVIGAANAHTALSDNSDASYLSDGDSAEVGAADPTIPAGAVVKRIAARIRVAQVSSAPSISTRLLIGGVSVGLTSQGVSWSSPTTITGPSVDAPATATDIDVRFGTTGDLRLYETYVDTTYVATPVVDVTAPVTPVGDTNRPLVEWTTTLDSDGGDQTAYEVRVFTDAQYTAGAFNPATSTATDESDITTSAATSWQGDELLPDDTYRAYVRVAQTVNGESHWSDWDYIEFTVAVDPPGVPLLTATADSVNGRVVLELDDQAGDATTDMFEVQRSLDGGATWETVRGLRDDGLIEPASGTATAYDYEAPNGTTMHYRARALHDYSGVYAASAWATDTASWTSANWWLKHPLRPELNVALAMDSQPDRARAARQGIFHPLGATYPIIVTDTRGSATGTIRVRTDSTAERDALDAILDTVSTLLLQGPLADGEHDRYVHIGDHARQRGIDKSFAVARFDTLPWIEVAAPSGVVTAWPA